MECGTAACRLPRWYSRDGTGHRLPGRPCEMAATRVVSRGEHRAGQPGA